MLPIFSTALINFDLVTTHDPGIENGNTADALSCNRLDLFFLKMSNASSSPIPLPLPLLDGSPRMGNITLDDLVQAIGTSTVRTYNSAQSYYRDFCTSKGIPVLPLNVGQFVTSVATQNMFLERLPGSNLLLTDLATTLT